MPKKHETLQMRRERLKRNKEARGMMKSVHGNNRKGSPHRQMIQKENAHKHYERLVKLGYM